jgi:hypothetical protein
VEENFMKSGRKSWQQRVESAKNPVVKLLEFDFAGLKRGTTMLISSPHEVDTYIQAIPPGENRSIEQLRADLAAQHQADATCPVSTAIFLRVVSEAACERLLAGAALENITPFWRVVVPGSRLAQKLECGEEFLVAQRTRETLKR